MAGELRDHRHAAGNTSLTADAVIIGSGPGGAAVSRALAERGLRVVVLEEGPATPRFRPNLAHTARYHMQESGAMVAASRDGFMPVAAGRGVGGGSLINSAICFRTPDPILAAWANELRDTRYHPEQIHPVFDELEAILQVGPTLDAVAGENNRIIVRGAAALGLPGGLVRRNAPGCVGCGQCNYGCPVGGKASVDRNLLPMALAKGAVVQADVTVDAIRVEGGRATGVSGAVLDPDTRAEVGRITVRAPRVFVCAGGVGTPRLLHHTGLARALGPAVGEGLHVHPGNAVLGVCDHEVRMWQGATQGAWFEHPDHPGVLPHTLTAPPEAVLLALGGVGPAAKETLQRLPHVCGCVVMVSDKGAGTVRATASGRARIQYHFDEGDLPRIKAGMVETARVLFAGGARAVTGIVRGVGLHHDPASFAAALDATSLHDFTLYSSHPMASCRMGLDPDRSVVGPDGAAHRLPGLYVADSSVFPTSLGVNPQLSTMALAHWVARRLVAQA